MWRKILGAVAGVVVALVLVMVGEFALHAAFPMPAVDMTDKAAVSAMMAAAPLGAKLGLAVVYMIATLGGAFVGTRVARWRFAGGVVTGVMLAATIANYVMLPHPLWLIGLSLVLIVAGGWLGARLGGKA